MKETFKVNYVTGSTITETTTSNQAVNRCQVLGDKGGYQMITNETPLLSPELYFCATPKAVEIVKNNLIANYGATTAEQRIKLMTAKAIEVEAERLTVCAGGCHAQTVRNVETPLLLPDYKF